MTPPLPPRAPQTPKHNDLSDRFNTFFDDQWCKDDLYTISDFAHLFGIDNRLSRYYLLRMTEKDGKLCQIKHKGRTYYAHRVHKKAFDQFKFLGVKVL
jgi:hypothetical protein